MNISNKPCHCQCRNTDYWKDDTLRDANMCRVFWGFFLCFFFIIGDLVVKMEGMMFHLLRWLL